MPRQSQTATESTKSGRQRRKPTSTKRQGGKSRAAQTVQSGNVRVSHQHVAGLYEFTNDFFALFGSSIKRVDRKKYGPLTVTLSPELIDYFGAEQLNLAFSQAEPVQGQFLVAHGSPIFDKMVSYLERKSAVALQQLPARHTVGEELLRAIQPTNAGIVNLRTQQETHYLYAFHWRITYRADDKREELYTVLLDNEGRRVPNPHEDGLSDGHATSPMAIDTLLVDAEPPPNEADDDGNLVPAKLPPMTQLVRLAETARKYAVYHADVRCVSHEAEILPRLYKTLNRLSTYYQQQIEEVYDAHDADGEKRRALEVDLERKLAEEVENHRLRVQLQLVSYVVLRVPVAKAQMTLSDGKQDVTVTLERDRYSGLLRRPRCYTCHAEIAKLALDRNGHVICDNCVRQCESCQDLLCATCGVEPCPACGKENCDSCGQLCWACGERACSEHISSCPTCGDAVCHHCQTTCAGCGVRQCRSHLRLDHVRSQRGETVLVCSECAIRCSGCNQYSAEVGRCEFSGQQFCRSCLVTCTTCGKAVGPGFYEHFAEQPYCHSCLQECPACHNWALTIERCPLCDDGYCSQCGQPCALCGQTHCATHSHYFGSCDHTICQQHIVHCTSCQAALCPRCSDQCAICGGHHCDEHVAYCGRCSQRYCKACISANGFCVTCANIDPERDAIDLHKESCAADPRVQALVDAYQWAYGANERYNIYVGENPLGQKALVVTTTEGAEERIVVVKGKGIAAAKGNAKGKGATPTPPSPPSAAEEKDPNEWMHEFQDWLRRMRRRRGR